MLRSTERHLCAARPTYDIMREQLDEAKQVVLDSMVKIWVKTGSFYSSLLHLNPSGYCTLPLIQVSVCALLVPLKIQKSRRCFHVLLILSWFEKQMSPLHFSSPHRFHLFHSCIIDVTALFVSPSLPPPVVSSECPMGVTA